MYILTFLFGLPRRRSREECTIEGAAMIEGEVGEGEGGVGEGEGGVGEGGGDGNRGGGNGNWEKLSELARMGRGRQADTRYKQTTDKC